MVETTEALVTITPEQGEAVWRAISIWKETVYKATGEWPNFSEANLRKSCLLGRLLYEGKPPLDEPPPVFHAAPQYELAERGRGLVNNLFVSFGKPGHVLMGGRAWRITGRVGDGFLIRYHDEHGGIWLLHRQGDPETWLLERYEPATTDTRSTEGGDHER